MENNLNLYYIFHAVAKAKNISGAAKELYISQPAISKAISKLEQNLNTTLFIRNSRGVCLTKEGEILFEQIQTAFQCIHTGEEKLRLSNELGIGHLSIGASSILCKFILLPYLKRFTKNNPHIQISISCQNTFETLDALNNNSIDIGLIGFPEHKLNLELLPVMEIQDTFVTTSNYLRNLEQRESLTRESILKNATFMFLDKENITRKYVDSQLAAAKIELSNIMEINSMDMLIDLAKIDLGIAGVFKEFVKDELEKGELKEIKITKYPPRRKMGFAYNKQTLHENPSLPLFLNEISKDLK